MKKSETYDVKVCDLRFSTPDVKKKRKPARRSGGFAIRLKRECCIDFGDRFLMTALSLDFWIKSHRFSLDFWIKLTIVCLDFWIKVVSLHCKSINYIK